MPDVSHLRSRAVLNLWDDPEVDCYDMLVYLSAGEGLGLSANYSEIRKYMLTTKQLLYWKNHYEAMGYMVRYAQSTFGDGDYMS